MRVAEGRLAERAAPPLVPLALRAGGSRGLTEGMATDGRLCCIPA